MGDIVAGFEEYLRLAWQALQQRSERLPAYPLEPNSDEGSTPEGHLEAFLAGARPPWPGPRAAPALVARWKELRRVAASGAMQPRLEAARRGRSQAPHSSNSGAAGLGASRWEGSSNWSGAILTARDGERFSAVTARWRVPDLAPSDTAPPPVAGPQPADPLSRRVSVWVGLDGHRDIAGSLPQLGTTSAEMFKDGRRWVETYAWAQWWVRGQQFGEIVFTGFRVSPGDAVTCWLALHDPTRVVMCIRNETTGEEDSVLWRSGTAPGGQPDWATQAHPDAAPVSGQAAVWVVERPMVMGRTDLYPLPDFGRVEFADCIAAVRGPDQPFHEAADLRALDAPRLIRMFDQRSDPWRAVRISMPDPPGETRARIADRRGGKPPALLDRLTVRYRA
jgi:hypothetical protein